jgi:hypothetical protein
MKNPTKNPSPEAPSRKLGQAQDGATMVEFAMIAPAFILLLMGVFDMAHTQYTSALINGAMQKAGRDLTLESAGSQQGSIDARVEQMVRNVVPSNATIEVQKLSHFDFNDIGEPEEIIEDDGNEQCDPGERFIDSNGSGAWEADRGADGIGGARDAVLYTVTVTYERLFPMHKLAGMRSEISLQGATVLRNQPYDEQDDNAEELDCT